MISHAREKGPERAFAKSYARAYLRRAQGAFSKLLHARVRGGALELSQSPLACAREAGRDDGQKRRRRHEEKGLFLPIPISEAYHPRQSRQPGLTKIGG